MFRHSATSMVRVHPLVSRHSQRHPRVLQLPRAIPHAASASAVVVCRHDFSTTSSLSKSSNDSSSSSSSLPPSSDRLRGAYSGHNFPDFVEHWNRDTFQKVGYALGASTGIMALATTNAVMVGTAATATTTMATGTATLLLGALTTVYWKVGLEDMKQTQHAIRRNFPVLGNMRYLLETIRPEIRQYLVEDDLEGKPYDRMRRSLIYQRAKNVDDTLAFGTRRDVYAPHHEWACHSMWPTTVDEAEGCRSLIGTSEFGTTQPYSASVLNISAMSYGAISDNAILALSRGAKMGSFYHNTGEGGVSNSHKQGGGDLVWNVGTGYFGCGQTVQDANGGPPRRVFDPTLFQETIAESSGQIKMIELKLSQGAKPGHGGILPQAKITPEIAEARKLDFPATSDCHSPPRHSAFGTAHEMVQFIQQVRELSGGLPVGIKLCVGNPAEIAALVHAMVDLGNGPDFITVDGAEGGTGAAPPEFSNSIGLPLEEGLVVVRNFLTGAGLRSRVKINASGRVTSGFSLSRTIALGADITCAARAFMMSLGCIQALKCNTNKCPTGIATQDKILQYGLDPQDKSFRVYNYHKKTVHAAAEIVGTCGYDRMDAFQAHDIMRRISHGEIKTLEDAFPNVEPGCLLTSKGPKVMQELWDDVGRARHLQTHKWIY